MAADRVPGGHHLPHDAGLPHRVLADRKEDCLGAVLGEGGEHSRRAARPRPIVEGQHHLAGLQEVVALEVLESETRSAGGVDLDHPPDAERVGIARAGCVGGGCWGCSGCGRRRPGGGLSEDLAGRLLSR
jgi:hypothetical protein